MKEQELLAHGEFIRGLARRLIPDDFWAADVAQQTMAAALEHPPSEEKPLGAWLATVTHNFARKFYRRESVRGAHERVFARPESMPSTASVVEREEIRRKVVNAVLDLEEPYRSTLLLRYYEELPPREVAKKMGVPVETMRTRMKRGLEQLRGRLDHLYGGDRSQWCLALAPFVGLKLAASAAGTAGVGSAAAAVFTTPFKIGAAALAVLALSWSLYWMWPEGREEALPGLQDDPARSAALQSSEENRGRKSPATATEPKIENKKSKPGEKVALASVTNRILEGVVVHKESKRPLEGLNIKIFEHTYSTKHPSDYLETTTDSDGRFQFTGVPWTECDVWLHDENYFCPFNEMVFFKETDRPDPLVLAAQPGTYLLIRVVDMDGKPVPRALLSIGKRNSNGGLTTQSPFFCNDEGCYFLNQGIETGTEVAVVAREAGSQALSAVSLVRPRAGGINETTLRLEGTARVTGRVMGADGKPIPGIQIRPLVLCPEESGFSTLLVPESFNPYEEPPYKGIVYTDDVGRFTVKGLSPGRYRLTAQPEDHDEAFVDITVTRSGGHYPKEIVLNLKRSLMVRGRAVDEQGAPVTGRDGACAFFYHTMAATSQIVRYSVDCGYEDGRVKIPSSRISTNIVLAGEDRVDMVVTAPGYVPFVRKNIIPGDEEIQAVLKRGARVSGQVVSSAGDEPLAKFRITRNGEEYNLEPDAFFYHCHSGDPWVQRFEDRRGRFTFEGLEPGGYRLAVEADGYTPGNIDVTIPPSLKPVEGIEVVLHPCLHLAGKVLRAETQEPFINADVTACLRTPSSENDSEPVTFYSDGLRTIKTAVTDASGRFKLDGLAPGSYELKVSKDRYSHDYWVFGPYEAMSGEEQDEITLRVEAPTGIVVVEVKDREGRPVKAGTRVHCSRPPDFEDGSATISGRTNDQGIARLEGVRSGRRALHVRVEDERQAWWHTREIDVLEHQETLVTMQQPGAGIGAVIRGRVMKKGIPCPDIRLLFSSTTDQSRSETLLTDSSGAFEFHGVEPGSYDIHGPDRKGLFIVVETGDRVIEQDIILESYQIAGTLRTVDQKPLENALAILIECCDESGGDAPGFPIRTAVGEKDGRFVIDLLDEGRYALYAWLRIGDVFYSGLLRNVEAWDDQLSNPPVSITLDKACELRISVPENQYTDHGDIRLFFLLDQRLEIEVRDVVLVVPEVVSGKRIHRHRRLLPGSYRVDFKTPSGAVNSRYVELKVGETVEIEE